MKTLLIDGKYFVYRAVNTKLTLSYKQVQTGALYLFFNSLQSIANTIKPNNVIIMLDSIYSYRKEIYPDYKKKDGQKDENLLVQIKAINEKYEELKDILQELNIASYLRYGLEADDLFAHYCRQYNKEEIVIATRDEDMYQLLSDTVSIYDPKNKKIKSKSWFKNEYNITPEQWVMIKAIGGCKSDNVKGIHGIGEGYALKFQQEILSQTSETYIRIQEGWSQVEANLRLVKLPFQSNKKVILRRKETNMDIDKFIKLCGQNGFKSFLTDLDKFEIFRK